MYAILEFDQMGLKDVDFRRVDYDVQKNCNSPKTSIFLIIKRIMKVWSMAFIIPTIMTLHEIEQKVMIEKSMLG